MRRTHVESDNLNEGLIGRLIALGVLVLTLIVHGAVTPSAGAQKPDAAPRQHLDVRVVRASQGVVEAYKAAHPGNGGKDWDFNAKTPEELATDPAAKQLLLDLRSEPASCHPVAGVGVWRRGPSVDRSSTNRRSSTASTPPSRHPPRIGGMTRDAST